MEKSKSSKPFWVSYTLQRFPILNYSLLSLAIIALSFQDGVGPKELGQSFVFVLTSLYVFRLLDDLASFHIDRKHYPTRMYILPENIRSFILFSAILSTLYFGLLFLYSPAHGKAIAAIYLISIVCYLPFYRKRYALMFISMIKYPVILWIIRGFPGDINEMFFAAGLFAMMLSIDIYEQITVKKLRGIFHTLTLLTAGFCLSKAWMNIPDPFTFFAMGLPVILAFTLPMKRYHLFPVLVFPAIYLASQLL